MKNLILKKIVSFTLILTLFLSCSSGSALAYSKSGYTPSSVTQEEIIKALNNKENVKLINNDYDFETLNKSYNILNETDNSNPKIMPRFVPAIYATYELYVLGATVVVIIYENQDVIIKSAGKIVDKTSQLYTATISAAKELIAQAKKNIEDSKNPTGRKVKDVQKRLKKEGFEKVKTNAGSHEKWKKGNKTVTVPNHGSNYEIPIGTLRSIWKQAGWI